MPKPITDTDRTQIAERTRQEVLIDLRAMHDQHRKLIAAGTYRPLEQLTMLKRRRAALEYAIECIAGQP